MNKHRRLAACFAVFIFCFPLSAQTHVSVPLDDPVYFILEQAGLRGLCNPLPAVKPYSRSVVLSAIGEILGKTPDSGEKAPGALSASERSILEAAKKRFEKPEPGFSLKRGAYHYELATPKKNIPFSGDIGIGFETEFSLGAYPGGGMPGKSGNYAWGADAWISLYTGGDMGEHFSYWFNLSGGLIRAPRGVLPGNYHTYYAGYPDDDPSNPTSYIDREITPYSEPLSYFPYDYQKKWDGYELFSPGSIGAGDQLYWPEGASIGSSLVSEISGEFWGDALVWRFGRTRREWGAMSRGNSLAYSDAARPFTALEATFNPIPWFSFSALTGALEFYKWESGNAENFQNLFSIEQLEINISKYVHIDFGSSSVWSKRFEPGYILPVSSSFLYQNNIGDFDNLALFGNLKVQYPGIGAFWISGYLDEIEIASLAKLFELDRHMFAFQVGITGVIPLLPFASASLSYTKIEPYTYTHTRIFTPWNGANRMETSYTNNGVSLGYYLPPNSDEIKLRFELLPAPGTQAHFQYQMIRSGAAHGSKAVDGSSLLSELDPEGRSEKAELKKFFLKDGAYQWMHIVKAGGEYAFEKLALPVTVFGEAGVVFSYYTDIDGAANSGSPSGYSVIDTDEYPKSTSFIVTLGFRLFL
jgi:hypothetical protein